MFYLKLSFISIGNYYDQSRHRWRKNRIIPQYKQDFDFGEDPVEDFPFSSDSDGDSQHNIQGLTNIIIYIYIYM